MKRWSSILQDMTQEWVARNNYTTSRCATSFIQFLLHDAMHKRSLCCAVTQCLSICPLLVSVTSVYYVEMSQHSTYSQTFSSPGRPTILVLPYQTLWFGMEAVFETGLPVLCRWQHRLCMITITIMAIFWWGPPTGAKITIFDQHLALGSITGGVLSTVNSRCYFQAWRPAENKLACIVPQTSCLNAESNSNTYQDKLSSVVLVLHSTHISLRNQVISVLWCTAVFRQTARKTLKFDA